MPWHDIAGPPEELHPEKPVAVICSTGSRAGTAAGLLRRYGRRDVMHVAEGGIDTWAALGLPLERTPQEAPTV